MGSGDPVLEYGDAAATAPTDAIVDDRVTEGGLVALETEALSVGPQQIIDGLFGTGWYNQWQDMRQETQVLRQRSAVNSKRFEQLESNGATSRLYWDVRTLESLARDFDDVMNNAASGKQVDVERAGRLYDMYTLAIGVVTEDNNALDAAFAVGLVAAFVAFPFALFRIRAQRLQELLKELKRQLEIAKRERTEALFQGLVDAAIAGVTSFTPLGLLELGGILVAQGLLDSALGPSTSTQATVGAYTSKAAEFAAAVDGVRVASEKKSVIPKGGGATATVVGFVFDINEIGVAYKNVDKLRAAMDQAAGALKKLNEEIQRNLPTLQRFVQQYQGWQASIADIRTQADLTLRALEDELRRNGYNVR
jgi:hypothetical protein